MEEEWKFEVADVLVLNALAEAPLPAGAVAGPLSRVDLKNCYLDTNDRILSRAREAFRWRSSADGREWLTLKAHHRREGAFHRMDEWECRVENFDLKAPWRSAGAPVDQLTARVGRVPLEVVVEFRTERRSRRIDGFGGYATLALDRTQWADGVEFAELELELGSGAPEPWAAWVEELGVRWDLKPSTRTKLARALERPA